MGCDIESWVEVYDPNTAKWTAARHLFPADEWERKESGSDRVSAPFRNRHYGLFGFLADVRNYACCEPLAKARGLPFEPDMAGARAVLDELDPYADRQKEGFLSDCHSHSWFLLSELLDFDYGAVFWNRRTKRGADGAALAAEGEGAQVSYRDFLRKILL